LLAVQALRASIVLHRAAKASWLGAVQTMVEDSETVELEIFFLIIQNRLEKLGLEIIKYICKKDIIFSRKSGKQNSSFTSWWTA
jgi:hypothetical protein